MLKIKTRKSYLVNIISHSYEKLITSNIRLVKLESVQILLKIIRRASRKSSSNNGPQVT